MRQASKVVPVAWEEDASAVVTTAAADRSILVGRPEAEEPAKEPEFVAQLQNDPFAGVDDDLLPEFDEEEPTEDSTEEPQQRPEPTIDDLFEVQESPSEPEDEPSVDEPPVEEPIAEEPTINEPAEEMTEEELKDDLFGEEISTEDTEEEAPKPEETPKSEEAPKLEEAPKIEQAADDPFDEPSIDQLPSGKKSTKTTERTLDAEIERRMKELDAKPLEEPETPPESVEQLEKELKEDTPEDSSTGKLFGDAEELDIEIGGPIDTGEVSEAERALQLEQLAKEREESQKNCEDEYAKMKSDRIDDIDLSLRIQGNPGEDYPYECEVGFGTYQPRQWSQITYNWKASGLCHKPLYFEQVQLERYGHTWGPYVQPIMSGVHFFGTLPILPYKMGLKSPNECVYTLGHYRPGSCAPYLVGGVPFTWRAALYQGAATTGLIFIFP